MASASATSCRCRSRFTCSAPPRRWRCRSSCSACSCAARRRRACGAQVDLLATTPVGRVIGHPAVVLALRLAVLALFVVTVLAGLFGDQNPYRNIAPTLVWIIWWVGLAYVAAFIGDVWALINPWRTVFDGAQWLWRLGSRTASSACRLAYPQSLGAWPACLLLLAFSWTELVYPNAASPAHIAWLAIAYSVRHLGGHAGVRPRCLATARRGVLAGFRHACPLCADRGAGRPAVAATLRQRIARQPPRDDVDDGIHPAAARHRALRRADRHRRMGPAGRRAARQSLPGLERAGVEERRPRRHLAPVPRRLSRHLRRHEPGGVRPPGPLEVARSFALTLVPIAIGYHVAHYLVFLLVQGQYIIPLLSDPFGRGWNLFGTAGYRVDIAVAGARFAWYTAVAAIVTGHVFAVYLAHRRAMAVFSPARVALATQVPLTALMVVYTFIGLSITAEPIVESRAGGDARGRERSAWRSPPTRSCPRRKAAGCCRWGPTRPRGLKLTYKVLGSAFHDGTKTSAADLLYAYAFAYRWGVRGGANGGALRPLYRCRHGAPAPASIGRAHRRRRYRLQVVPRRRRRFRARDLHCRGLPGHRCRRRPNGAPSLRRRGARCPGPCWC